MSEDKIGEVIFIILTLIVLAVLFGLLIKFVWIEPWEARSLACQDVGYEEASGSLINSLCCDGNACINVNFKTVHDGFFNQEYKVRFIK